MNDGGSKKEKQHAHIGESKLGYSGCSVQSVKRMCPRVSLWSPLEFLSTKACCTNTSKLGYFDMHCFSFFSAYQAQIFITLRG